MSEYDGLIKRLQNAAMWADKGLVIPPSLVLQAADAIEELQKGPRENDWWAKAKVLTDLVMAPPKWIPVTERSPEEEGKFLVCGQWRGKPMQIWICERVKLGPIFGWINRAENPVISHWMPLPEPPKEETE